MYLVLYANECKVVVVHCGSRWDYYYYYYIFFILKRCMMRRDEPSSVFDPETKTFIYSESVTGSCSMNH